MANKKISQVYADAPAAPLVGTEVMIGVRSGANVGFTSADLLTYINANIGTIPVSKGGTGLTTIAAKSILVANALNTYVSLTPAAGQSIRINAGNTAWEAYTPSGITNSAANNRLMKSDGINAIDSGLSATGSFGAVILSGIGSFNGNLMIANGGGTPNRRLEVEENSSSTNTVLYPLRITATSSNTPANGIGTGLEFVTETTSSNNEIGATIEAIVTDVTSTSEDFDLVFKTMVAGAAATEHLRFGSNKMAFFGGTSVVKQTSGANLTNNVTSGGTDDTITNWTDLTLYANDSAAIRNAIYQIARKVKQINDGLRAYNLFT